MEPPDYITWRSSENRTGIGRSWIRAAACPRPNLPVTMVDGEMLSVERTGLVDNNAAHRGDALRSPRVLFGIVITEKRRADLSVVGLASMAKLAGDDTHRTERSAPGGRMAMRLYRRGHNPSRNSELGTRNYFGPV